MTNNDITNKATGESRDIEREFFTQLYNIDFLKELRPNLSLNAGGLFKNDYSQSEVDGSDTDRRETASRPYVGLQLSSPILKSSLDYRTSDFKESGSNLQTNKRYLDEYSGRLDWRPVELPEVDFYFNNSHAYNSPATSQAKIDREDDSYQLSSRYTYQDYRFDYSHMTTDSRDKVSDSDTTANTDIGSVRYSKSFQGDRFTLNANTRLKRDKLEFTGSADRLVPTSSEGLSFYNLDDPPPATSNNVNDFIYDQLLTAVNLLQNGAPQLSFGLDFSIDTEVDTVYVQLVPAVPENNQASPSEIDNIKNLYSWSVFVSEDQLSWTPQTISRNDYDVFENRFEITFAAAKSKYVKIAVTPLSTILIPGKEILLSRLTSFRTLPEDTSTFKTTDWTTNMSLGWKLSERTNANFDILYRQERTEPFDGKRTLLSTSANLNHRFNKVFTGATRLLRSHVTERGEDDRTGYIFSASMGANYLDTFDQTLTYSLSHNDASAGGTDITNALLLRNNLYLYDGWSVTFDSGYSWKNPGEGENSNYTFARIENNIIPNRWMNFTLYYEVSWQREDHVPTARQETGRLIASWIPSAALSLTADILTDYETGRRQDSSTVQQYAVNWSPLRDGTLQFSVLYGMIDDNDGQDVWTVTPTARWQVNSKTLLTFDYSVGEREDDFEKEEFDTVRVQLRFFY